MTDFLDDLIAEMTMGAPPRGASSSSSSDDGDGKSFTLEDLDSLMAEVESSETHRIRQPALNDTKKLGARKTTTRKAVGGALAGQDLDTILENIMGAAGRKLESAKSELGWGVVSTDRKFDMRAPSHTPVGELCIGTLIVTLSNGERTRIPVESLSVQFVGMDGIRSGVDDNADGTYAIKFIPPQIGKVQINIDAYGTRQFEWQVEVCSAPDPATCKAVLQTNPPRINEELTVLVTACDSTGQPFKVGGANFSLGFAGIGQLTEVGLEDQLNGTYLLKATPNARGQYMIYISLGEVDIAASPVSFNVI